MKKRIPAILLLLCAALTAVSCGSAGEAAETKAAVTEGEKTAETEAVTEAVTQSDRPALDLPEANYEGYKFRVLEYEREVDNIKYNDFFYDDSTAGELVNDAVHQRNMIIEDRYNCHIVSQPDKAPLTVGRNSITAGSDDFDIVELYINNAMSMAMEGYLYNMYDIPHLALDQPWWDQAIQRDLAILDKIFVMTGDISLFDEELNYCVYFNKKTAQDYDVPDLYQRVRDNHWTLDEMYNLGKQVNRDLNGDGKSGEEDAFGVLSDGGMLWLFYYTSGCTFSTLDENGEPKLYEDMGRATTVVQRLVEFYNDKETVFWAANASNSWTTLDQIFMEDRALFRPGSIYDIIYYRNMNTDFGILPYPKFDEAQEDYYHPIATQCCPAVSVPSTAPNLDRTGLLLEAFAYESRDTVTKAYYDVNLYTKLARDNESGEMLDIIFATKRYDLCKVFNWGSICSILDTIANNKKDLSSLWDKRATQAIAAMEKTMDFYRTNE